MYAKRQVPFPKIVAQDLSSESIELLNERDYLLERGVEPLLEEELAIAEKQLHVYENPSFPGDDPLELPITSSTVEECGVANTQGLREAQEDTHLIFSSHNLRLRALFDGHLGSKCSLFCHEHYEECFEKRLADPELNALPEEDFLYNVLALSLVDLSRSFPLKEPGCTANVALIEGNKLFVANVGDSRALFVTKREVIGLSCDARATQERFFIDIVERGGLVTMNYTVAHPLSQWTIAPAQSIGDHHLRGAMNPRPKISKLNIEKEGILIQACDGLFDVASTMQVGKRVQQLFNHSPEEIARTLVQDALNSGSTDNITVLVTKI